MNIVERDMDRLKGEVGNFINLYVTFKHFDAVVNRLQSNQDEMGKDIKTILRLISKT